jgi:hypothetical protein
VHVAFLANVEQVLMPTLIPGDSVIMENPADRRLVTIVSINVAKSAQAKYSRKIRG